MELSRSSSDSLSRLIYELSRLPGIGEKTATRLAYFILRTDAEYAHNLAAAVVAAKERIQLCSRCFNFTDIEPCALCTQGELGLGGKRDAATLCVVERPSDVHSIEASGQYRGLYHVLHGALSPMEGIGPDDLKIRELLARLAGQVREVILATNPSVEGDATAIYLTRLLRPLGVKVTQLASGLPMGGQLEYTDRQTIGRALQNRIEVGAT